MDIARLKGYVEKIYRLRIGDYRVVFLATEEAVYVLRVISRQELEKSSARASPLKT